MSDINEQDERMFEETIDRLHRNKFDRYHWRPKILTKIVATSCHLELIGIIYEREYQKWLEKNSDIDLNLGHGEAMPLRQGADKARIPRRVFYHGETLDEYFTKTEDEHDNR